MTFVGASFVVSISLSFVISPKSSTNMKSIHHPPRSAVTYKVLRVVCKFVSDLYLTGTNIHTTLGVTLEPDDCF